MDKQAQKITDLKKSGDIRIKKMKEIDFSKSNVKPLLSGERGEMFKTTKQGFFHNRKNHSLSLPITREEGRAKMSTNFKFGTNKIKDLPKNKPNEPELYNPQTKVDPTKHQKMLQTNFQMDCKKRAE